MTRARRDTVCVNCGESVCVCERALRGLPSVLLAQSGTASLCLVATHWRDEGTCLVEILSPDRSHATVVQSGIWRLTSAEEGPRVLSLEIDDPGVEGWGGLLGRLQAEAVLVGASWGIDTWQL